MRFIKQLARGAAAAGAAVAIASVTVPAPAQAAGSLHGCAYLSACIYNNASLSSGIRNRWVDGTHNLSGAFGNKAVVNNQSGNWIIKICYEYNGRDCRHTLWPGQTAVYNFDPIDSVVLQNAGGSTGLPG
jgi:hypothetical protein